MRKILFIILFLPTLIYSQINRINRPPRIEFPFLLDKVFFSELYVTNQDSSLSYFIYKVPLNRLLFEKNENIYSADFNISLELYDENKNIVQREFDQKSAKVVTYEETKSRKDFIEGIIPIVIDRKVKYAIPTFTDLNSERVFKGKQLNIENSNEQNILEPIVVKNKIEQCDKVEGFELANYGGDIPFSENKYKLLIPVSDKNTNELFIKIISNSDTLFNSKVNNYFKSNFDLKICNGDIFKFENGDNDIYKFFILENFESKLSEGPFKIVISNTADFNNSTSFIKKIVWFDKPFSLRNSELAIKNLKFIESDSVIDSLLDNDSYLYTKLINEYWKKFDPTPNTEYNPIMNEYYERIDYSTIHFMPISRKSGANTDRGKIYIKYGKPNEIKRTSNTLGQVTEIWIYNNVNKQFVFIDKYGIGDFSLITG